MAAVHPSLDSGFFNYGCGFDGVTANDLRQAAAWMAERGCTPYFYLPADAAAAAAQASLVPDGSDYILMAADAGGEKDPAVCAVGPDGLPGAVAMLVAEYPFPDRWRGPLTDAYGKALRGGGRLYATYEDGKPVAALLLVPDGAWAGIYGVVTAASHRGRGIGGRLVRHAMAAAREAGCRMVTLQVAPGAPAERLYRRLGFGPAGTLRGYRTS